jgi:hypothetical protein
METMMLGNHDVPKSLPGIVSGGRAAVLVFALATATSFFAIGSAQAQDCEGGFRMLKDEIPVACDGGSGQSATGASALIQSEPLHTGSINAGGGNADEIPSSEPSTHMSGMKCVGGYAYRGTANESYITMPMPCN